jgi:hypothetical protein
MKDANGGLSVLEKPIPTIGWSRNKPVSMKDEEWEVHDRKALEIVWLCLVALVAFNISKQKTTTDLMKALAKLYEKPSASNKVFLMKHLFNMNISEGGSIIDHLNDFNMVTSQLCSIGVNFDDEDRAILILCSLPEIWNGLVMVVSNYVSGSRTLKFDHVVGVILSEDMQQKRTAEISVNSLTVENMKRKRERGKSLGNHGKLR